MNAFGRDQQSESTAAKRVIDTLRGGRLVTETVGKFTMATYDIAVWFRISRPVERVSLVLHYADQSGQRSVIVDDVSPRGPAVMLSGRSVFRGLGLISEVMLSITGLPEHIDLTIDELHVKPVSTGLVPAASQDGQQRAAG